MKRAAAAQAPTSLLARTLRRAKYYVLINAFISGVAFASHQFVSRFQTAAISSASTSSITSNAPHLLAVYGATAMRIAAVVLWFDWIASLKPKILGDKRVQLTAAQRTAICQRILWLVVPTECLSFWIATRVSTETSPLPSSSQVVSFGAFVSEFADFIPKSLAFEVIFDLFHYAAHWLCHQSTWLYQHAHKRHHMHLHPCPLSTYEQDAVDLCLTNVLPFFLAVRLGLPLSELQLHLVLAYKTYVEVAGHSGLEIKGFSFPQLPWLNELFPICLRVHDHDLHHAHPKFNFAKRFSLWDKLFGTFRAGRPLNEPSSPKL